jgi:hypothetical protein
MSARQALHRGRKTVKELRSSNLLRASSESTWAKTAIDWNHHSTDGPGMKCRENLGEDSWP